MRKDEIKMTEKEAKKVAEASVGENYKLKSLGSKGNTFVFHANDDGVIPSDIIIAVNKDSGKTGISMYDINDAVKVANR